MSKSVSLLCCSLTTALALGCASVPETRYFSIGRIVPEAPGSSPRINLSVGVPQFEAEGLYARDNLLYRKGPYEIAPDYYRRWSMAPQKMLSEATLEYVRASGLFAWARRMPGMARVDLILAGRILRFEEETDSQGLSSSVRLELEFSLELPGNRNQVWRDTITAVTAVGTLQSAEAIVAAAEKSLHSCLEQLSRSLAEASPQISAAVK